jgi:peptidoglycan/LPS O-acetylase OafA/YrhL
MLPFIRPSTNTPHRNNGLDTLRAAAIALVFMYHYMAFVSGTPTFGWASRDGAAFLPDCQLLLYR